MSDSGTDSDTDISASRTELTTEDLARPGRDTTSEASPPSYPGEATAVPEGAEEPTGENEDEGRTTDEDEEEEEVTQTTGEGEEPLIAAEEAESYQGRWEQIQGAFVDDPKEAVRAADSLVAEVIQSLAETFSDHKKELEAQWSRGEEVKTEGLRLALQQYRTFFNKLLHA
ncbi:hypothetical protein OIB37_34465 [Streptomyces sp. NBC_00820]|uniref:hypothetical protein n=1 Tax=Streptomyces sp. NBC_00820 TaxID=2975842 RepID=UPI002ED42C6A|nr:hypothetical protein OIB37_34465 [Streptomyces sp. NBC_00820]